MEFNNLINKNGKEHGFNKWWYKVDSLSSESEYKYGDLVEYKKYYEDGGLDSHVIWKDGYLKYLNYKCWEDTERNSIDYRTHHHYLDDVIIREDYDPTQICYYKNHGKQLEWYKDGSVKSYIDYVYGDEIDTTKDVIEIVDGSVYDCNGIFTGTVVEYWEDGRTLKRMVTYEDGIKHGKFYKWYRNGNMAIRKKYYRGLLQGKYREWYKKGDKKIKAHYNDGKFTSEYTYYKLNGKVQFTFDFSTIIGEQYGI